MKKLLTTTALGVVLIASSAGAASLTADSMYQSQTGDISASEFIGSRIYSSENEIADETAMQAGDEKNWDDVGEVNDVILSKNGEVEAIVVGVGGFIGIGEKDVAISMKDVKFVSDGEDADDYFLVISANKEILTDAPEYKYPSERQAAADTGMNDEAMQEETAATEELEADGAASTDTAATDDMATDGAASTDMAASGSATTEEPASTDMAASDAETTEDPASSDMAASDSTVNEDPAAQDMASQETSEDMATDTDMAANDPMLLNRPEVEVEGYGNTVPEDLTAEALQGTTVYGTGDESIGDVADLVLADDGKTVEKLVIDVGGFLGIGEHRIAVGLDEVNIQKSEDGSDFRVYIDNNQEALEARPEYEG